MPKKPKTMEELEQDNEFVVKSGYLEAQSPESMIFGITGIPAHQLVEMIVNNEGGQFDRLYKKKAR